MAQTAVEAWIEEGMARGMEKGLEIGMEKGLAQGLMQGQLLNARNMLKAFLQKRFGDLPDALVEQINAANNLGRLQAAVEQSVQLENLADLQL